MFDIDVNVKYNIIHVKIIMPNWWVNATTSEYLRQRITDEQARLFTVDNGKILFRQNRT